MASTALVDKLFDTTESALSAGVRGFDVPPGSPRIKDINAVPLKEKFVKNFNTSYKQEVLDAAEPVSNWKAKFNSLSGRPAALAAATGGAIAAVGGGYLLHGLADAARAIGDEQSAQILAQLAENAKDLRGSNTGDGDPDTVFGNSDKSVKEQYVIQQAQYALIDKGFGAVGTLHSFIALREAIFAIEDEYLEQYRDQWPNGRPRSF